jgi:predicted metal-dependent HD superfamily phosphohydrolase
MSGAALPEIDWRAVRTAVLEATNPPHAEVLTEDGECTVCQRLAAAYLAAAMHLHSDGG